MRLVCPNCDATYEVPDSVIPDEGRDVQCSNCGTSWFFNPKAPIPEAEPGLSLEPEQEPSAPTIVSAPPPPPPRSEELTPVFAAEPEEPASEPELTNETLAEPKRMTPRSIEPEVANVLREEAAFEARAREKEQELEVQDSLPLDSPPQTILPNKISPAPSPAKSSRRDLLPDIDEINSTLRSASERPPTRKQHEREKRHASRKRRGFRVGFGLVALLLGAAAALYGFAPQVKEAVPSLAPLIDSYVSSANVLRVWLEDTVNTVVEQITVDPVPPASDADS